MLATPALQALRDVYPSAHVALLAPAWADELLQNTGLVDEVIACDLPWTASAGKYAIARYRSPEFRALVARLRAGHYDLALDARMDLRNHLLMAASGARRRVGYDYGGAAFTLTDRLVPDDAAPHRVHDWMGVVRQLGATGDYRLRLATSEEERQRARDRLTSAGYCDGLLVGIHPGASSPVRRWDPEKFAAVARFAKQTLGAQVMLFDDGEGACPVIENAIIVRRTSIRDFLALVEQCDAFVCNDSGPMHVAAALDVPTVSIFTSQRAEWYAPLGDRHAYVTVEGFTCRPCFDACVLSEPYCNTSLEVQPVIDALQRVVTRERAG